MPSTVRAVLAAVAFMSHPSALLAAANPMFSTTSSTAANAAYSLVADFSGANFFDGFTFQNITDPTAGFVRYVSGQTAAVERLAGYILNETANSTAAYLGVDHTGVVTGGRNSVRITTNATFSNGALVVADVLHMPLGLCGTWGALWTTGPDWPTQGEIDIIEGVNDNQYNSMTLHTSTGCSTENTSASFLGTLAHTDCDAYANGNSGCGIVAPATATLNAAVGDVRVETCKHSTAGAGFNAQGGGLYVMLWTDEGISVYLFPHDLVPADLNAGMPDPGSWTTEPLARFTGSGCNFATHFSNQAIVIDTDFCGDWAGSVWSESSCPATTGYSTCDAFVAAKPDAFREAYWSIASVKVYQTEGGTNTGAGVGVRKRGVGGEQDGVMFPSIDLEERYQDLAAPGRKTGGNGMATTYIRSGTEHARSHRHGKHHPPFPMDKQGSDSRADSAHSPQAINGPS